MFFSVKSNVLLPKNQCFALKRSDALSRPVLAVQVAVADGFGQVGGLDGLAAVEVGNGAGYLEDTVVGAGREVAFLQLGKNDSPVGQKVGLAGEKM